MSYRLQSKESISKSIKQIIDEQINSAIHQLAVEIQSNPEEAIHEARKCFKKIRAVLRMVRDGLGKESYKQENACFREAGRSLSGVRDAQVMLNTLALLREHSTASISSDFWQELEHLLATYAHLAGQKVLETENIVASVVATLKLARERVGNWPDNALKGSVLQSGLKRVYRRGYEGFNQAMAQPTSENLHEWRKRVKYLWYHLRILKPIWPNPMGVFSKEVHQLADYLGEDHDLAVFRQLLTGQPKPITDHPSLAALLDCLQVQRAQLQLSAESLGHRVYAESPKPFIQRLGAYRQTWQADRKNKLNSKETKE